MTASLTALKNVLTPLAKSILVLLVTASATDTTIKKFFFCSGTTTLIILIEEKNDFMKIVKSLEKPGLLIKGATETNENEAKE